MADLALVPEPEPDEEEPRKRPDRDKQLAHLKSIQEQLFGGDNQPGGVWDDIESGFIAQAERSNQLMDNWDAYKCRLSGAQYYNGNSRIFFPILANAIRARTTRFSNQAFPQSGRYVDGVTANGDIPFAQIALLEHYVRVNRLKNTIVKPLLKNGDIEGNYTIYVDWKIRKRKVAMRAMMPVEDEGEARPEFGEVEDMAEEEIEDAWPDVEVINDSDFLVLPVTAKTIEEALEAGGSVSVRRRFTKRMIKLMIEEGDIAKRYGEAFLTEMSLPPDPPGRRDTAKQVGEAAGIRVHKGVKTAVVCETWARLKIPGGERELCRVYFGGNDIVLGVKRNPYWNDRCPIISEPLDRDATSIKGRPPIADCMDIQVAANDMVNEAVDVSAFAAMPIVTADPEKNPNSATMVLGLGAVWDIGPNDVAFKEFPALYEKLLPFIERLEQAIYQSLGVNPSMLPNSTGKPGAKRNQAEVALEQQVDILTTADAVTVLEDVLNQMLIRFVEYDHQFRDKPLTVREFGPMGREANMQDIEPITLNKGYEFVWSGVEAARNAAMAQQQIAFLATLMKIPPQMLPGYKLNLAPAVLNIALTQLGARQARLVLEDLRSQQSVPPEEEEQMLQQGFSVLPHPMDDDVKHLKVHIQAAQSQGDPHGVRSLHIQGHLHQRQAKALAAQQQMQAQGPRGRGGGQTTQPGSQAQAQVPGRGPPGMQPQDQLGPTSGQMPRRA